MIRTPVSQGSQQRVQQTKERYKNMSHGVFHILAQLIAIKVFIFKWGRLTGLILKILL